MDDRPIGVFDSGLGGLTAVAEIRSILPSENIIYFGDTSRVPYGGRSPEILLKYARQDVKFLRSFDIKAVVVACGTVSTTALPQLKAESDLPILGVVEPACRRAVKLTRSKKVGLIATSASVRSGEYERTIARIDPTVEVMGAACPLFVPLVENGRFSVGDKVVEQIAEEYLAPRWWARSWARAWSLSMPAPSLHGNSSAPLPPPMPSPRSGQAAISSMPATSPATSPRWQEDSSMKKSLPWRVWILICTKERDVL